MARSVLVVVVVKPGIRFPVSQELLPCLAAGRLTWDDVLYRIDDQAVLGNVMFIEAQPARTP